MKILIFGISSVGKTTTGKALATRLNFDFKDLDDEIKSQFGTTDKFQAQFPFPYERDLQKGKMLAEIVDRAVKKNLVMAVNPIYYARAFNRLLERENVLGIELQDTVEHIYDRVKYYDEEDQLCEDSDEYKEKYKTYILREIKQDLRAFKNSYKKIELKYQMDGKSTDVIVEDLVGLISENLKEGI